MMTLGRPLSLCALLISLITVFAKPVAAASEIVAAPTQSPPSYSKAMIRALMDGTEELLHAHVLDVKLAAALHACGNERLSEVVFPDPALLSAQAQHFLNAHNIKDNSDGSLAIAVMVGVYEFRQGYFNRISEELRNHPDRRDTQCASFLKQGAKRIEDVASTKRKTQE